jgi:hypothetical protein
VQLDITAVENPSGEDIVGHGLSANLSDHAPFTNELIEQACCARGLSRLGTQYASCHRFAAYERDQQRRPEVHAGNNTVVRIRLTHGRGGTGDG